ncbi:MAG TPA: helix-turn-helix domain-containing protein [Anaerolineae bacterium]|nr:helix-turn-helix domain-containing protein [Anaerolineae bacterium]
MMRGRKPVAVMLTDEEKNGLNKLIRRHNVSQQIAKRARVVLAADVGKSNSQIVREMSISRDMARLWRQRWIDLQPIALEDLSIEERLEDLPRPGAPARITPDQICQIQQMACEKPEESGRPITHWTNREVADEVMKRGIVEQISSRHAARLLKKGP